MKKYLILAMVFASVLCKGEVEVIAINDICQKTMENVSENERFKFVIKLPKGTELPMSIFIDGDFFTASTEGEPAFTVTVQRDLFLKAYEDDFLASLDGENWKTVEEFFTGCFGWSVCDDAATKFGLYFHANLRKD